MKEGYAFITEPGENTVHELNTVEALIEYQKQFHTGFPLTDKEAEMILGYMEGHDYVLGEVQGNFYRGDLAEVRERICWEECSMDDAIDAVCEWNYELVLEAEAQRNNPEDFIDFAKSQSRYERLKAEEEILDQLFDQTKYGKELEELAIKLAGEFLAHVNPTNGKQGSLEGETKELEETIASVTEQIHQYGSTHRGR